MKFGRSYFMSVTGSGTGLPHVFRYPQPDGSNAGITMQFDVQRHNLVGLNEARFSLYNLSPASRADLFYDPLAHRAPMFAQAGYASERNLSTIFDGEVYDSYPERVGQDVIMRISGTDGLLGTTCAQIPFGVQFKSGTLLSQKVRTVAQSLAPYGISLGRVDLRGTDDTSSFAVETPVGSAWSWLQKNLPFGGQLYIDMGRLYFLSVGVAGTPPTAITTITDDMGILDIPKKFLSNTTVKMVFEPSFNIGQPVGLVSSLNPAASRPYPGYTVVNIHHYGTISPVESGLCVTEIDLLANNVSAVTVQ